MKKALSGSELVGYIKERQAKAVRALRQSAGVNPKLVIIRTNPDPVVDSYMRLKSNYGKDILVDVDVLTIKQGEAIKAIQRLNKDNLVHGIIVQIPLPDPNKTDEILNAVAPEKDVDALGNPDAPWSPQADAVRGDKDDRAKRTDGTENEIQTTVDKAMRRKHAGMAGSASQQGNMVRGSRYDPATPMAINWLLAGYNIDLAGKHLVIVGHGRLVGRPLAKIWKASGYDVEVADKKVQNLSEVTRHADVIVTATGAPGIIKANMVKPDAVIVDAGVATDSNGLVGDVAPEVREMPEVIMTPEKGGVGPLTVCALFENVITAARDSTK